MLLKEVVKQQSTQKMKFAKIVMVKVIVISRKNAKHVKESEPSNIINKIHL